MRHPPVNGQEPLPLRWVAPAPLAVARGTLRTPPILPYPPFHNSCMVAWCAEVQAPVGPLPQPLQAHVAVSRCLCALVATPQSSPLPSLLPPSPSTPSTAFFSCSRSMRSGSFALCAMACAALAGVATSQLSGTWFDHIVILQFENHSEKEALADPNFSKCVPLCHALAHRQHAYWEWTFGVRWGRGG